MAEEEINVRKYFKRIISSMSVSLMWMLVNSTFGIMFNFAFFDSTPTIGNYIFYGWFVLSLFALIFYLYKLWK